MHRSGTSVVSNFAHTLFPIHSIELLKASEDNPEGFWEDLEVLELNIDILRFLNSDWDSLKGIEFSRGLLKELDSEFGHRTKKLLNLRLEKSSNWVFKDPRTTKLLPFWMNQLSETDLQIKLVFCNRSPLAIAHSLKVRNNLPIEYSLILYSLYLQATIPLLLESDYYIVNYEELFDVNDLQLQELIEFLNVDNENASELVINFNENHLKSDLNHHQKHRKSKSYPASPFKWYQLLLDIKAGKLRESELTAEIDRFQLMAEATRDVSRLTQEYFDEVQSLELKSQDLSHQVDSLAALSTRYGQEKQGLLLHVASQDHSLKDQEQTINDQKKSISIQSKRINELEGSHHENAKWQQKQLSEIESLQSACNDFEMNNLALKGQEKQLTRDVKSLTQDIELRERDIDILTKDLNRRTLDIDVLSQDIGKREKDIELLTHDIGKREKDIELLTLDIGKREKDINVLTQDIRLRMHDIDLLTRDIKKVQNNYDGVVSELKGLGAEYSNLNQISEKNNKHVLEKEEQVEQLKQKLKSLHLESGELSNQLRVAQEHREALQFQVHTLETEVKRIWEIVEKFRLKSIQTQTELDEVYASLSWKVTKPLRLLNYFVFFGLPKFIINAFRFLVRTFLSLFPKKLKLNQRIHLLKERFMAGLRGEADSSSNRKSFHKLFENRQSVTNHLAIQAIREDDLPVIDLSIVSYNNGAYISEFMKSLISQNYPLGKICMAIVDNSSTDDTLSLWQKIMDEHGPKFRNFDVYERDNNGFGAGHDFAIKKTTSDYILVANIDLEFTDNSLTNLLSFAIQDSEKTASWEMRQKPYEHPKYYDPVTLETAWSSHACVLIRRSAYIEVEGYEKSIFMYGEDVELSYRFRDRGYVLKYIPSAVVFHYAYAEENEFKPLQFFGSTLSNSLLRLRYGTFSNVLNIVPMYVGLLRSLVSQQDLRKEVIRKNVMKIPSLGLKFLSSRKTSEQSFSFYGWDYELCRDGAFYTQEDINHCCSPLVSIIVRTYPGRDYWIRECLSSLLNQTYPNIEIIVVEDGADSQERLICDLRSTYPSSNLVYRALPKKGRCYSANVALGLAKGKYIGFLDDDDLYFCDHVEVCINEIEKDDSLAGVYTLAWEVETKLKGKILEDGYEEVSHRTEDALRAGFDREVLKIHNLFPIQAVLFHRSLYEEYGGLDLELDNLEDWNLWVRYSSRKDFKLIQKTTSMFRTPHAIKDRMSRQKTLDEYLPIARKKNQSFYDSLPQNIAQ